MDVASVLAESAERRRQLVASWEDYNPVLGSEQSPVPRFELRWFTRNEEGQPGAVYRIPRTMLADEVWAPLLNACLKERISVQDYYGGEIPDGVWWSFLRRRKVYDYEFYCASCVTIEDFATGQQVPFVLRKPQRDSFWAREQDRLAGRPVRQVEVKGRRYGSTTEKRTYVSWLQHEVYPGRHAFLISLDKGGSTAEIARGYELMCQKYPAWAGTRTLVNVRNSSTSRRVLETGSMIGIAAVNNPQGASGFPAHFAVFSEMGKMPSNEVQSADKLVTNVTSIIPQLGGTAVMMESTGERVGKLFKTYVEEAAAGRGSWSFHFTRWDADKNCFTQLGTSTLIAKCAGLTEEARVESWIKGWMAEETDVGVRLRFLWDEGCCLEQVAFFELVAREKPTLSDALQEFPWTWQEAFQYGERRRFVPAHVQAARETCRPPLRGKLVGKGSSGRAALKDIRFVEDPHGPLRLWHRPEDIHDGLLRSKPWRYSQPFCAAMDIGGIWEKADYTVVTVLDRRPTAHGLPPVVAAEWHGHLAQHEAAWEAARLAAWYEGAKLAVEVNSLKEDMGDATEGLEPDHAFTVLDQIDLVYPNLYRRVVYDQRTKAPLKKLGYHMNKQTKVLVIDTLHAYLQDASEGEGGYVERELGACAEMDAYLVLDDGKMAAAEGFKDDRVMTRGILLRVHDEMPTCVLVEPDASKNRQAAARRRGAARART